jgi:hypothetical protein
LSLTQYASATTGASLSSRWTSSGTTPGARPLGATRVRRSHLVRIQRTRQIRGSANSRNGSPCRMGASSGFPNDCRFSNVFRHFPHAGARCRARRR